MADTKDHLLPEKKEKRHISQNLRVLAIDDNVVCLKVLACKLHKCGYQVTATTKASEAIEMLRKNRDKYDIVITDVIRSDMDGFKILEIIGLELDIPVIMLSANGDMKTVEKGVKHGAIDYLVKPVAIEILKNIWQHVLRKTVFNPKSEAQNVLILSSLPKKRHHHHQRDIEDESGQSSDEYLLAQKKPRVVWKPWLHQKFVAAVQQLEVDKAVPKKILEIMNEPQLTRESVASHLQKYRNALRKQKECMSDEERQSFMDTNGLIPHICNHRINHSNTYNESWMSSFTGRNPPFLPLNCQGTALQHHVKPSEAVNQIWENMDIPLLKNTSILTADLELSAMKYQSIQHQRNMVDHSLQVFSRPYSYSPPAFIPDAPCQRNPFSEPHSALEPASNALPGQEDRRNLVSVCGKGGSEFRGESTAAFPVDMQGQLDGSSGNDQLGYTQSFIDSSERSENNGHHMIEGSPDYDLSVIIKQFASDAAPRI